jgi:hypothetical protein
MLLWWISFTLGLGLGRLLLVLVNLVRAWRHRRRSCRESFGFADSEA